MLKLTKPVNPSETPERNPLPDNVMLSKPDQTTAEPHPVQESPANWIVSNDLTPAVTVELKQVTAWLLKILEDDIIDLIKNNPNLQIPYTASDATSEEWLTNALKTILSLDAIETIGSRIQTKIVSVRVQLEQRVHQLQQEKAAIEEEVSKQKNQIEQSRVAQESAEVARFRAEKQLNVSVDLRVFIESCFWEQNESELRQLFTEGVDNPTQDMVRFITRFAPAWGRLKSALSLRAAETEQDQLLRVRLHLSELLRDISGLYILQRRSILDVVARYASQYMASFDFISPEESMQVDTSIHNAQGLGSTLIMEGLSFAVVRKQTRQTVYYADVKVQ